MKYSLFSLIFCLFFALNAFSQEIGNSTKTFEKDGIKFNYPSDWTITDKSSSDNQLIYLSKDNPSVLITIWSPRAVLSSTQQYIDFQRDSFSSYSTGVINTLTSGSRKPAEEYLCLDFNGRRVTGTKYTGTYNNEPAIGEVYPFALGNRFLTMVYTRIDKANSLSDPVWTELIKSFSLSGSNKDVASKELFSRQVDGGVLNGKALKLERPVYTHSLIKNRVTGTVRVKVLIDEKGKVIKANSEAGNSLLFSIAEEAAKKSRFSPTQICGEAVRVTGIITYNFVP
ncbi:MAG TPA: energy transducer TonB [Pyrinomonadaceae bacterium]|nr:energy transducer TonB [Pyrinomonadaceae bacterium]